jgi:transcriptional regulator with XRE-family HTH domain
MAGRSRKNGKVERERCRVDGAKLRRLRLEAELSIRDLAWSTDVDPKTVTAIEAGRRAWTTVRVARSLASHQDINVDWKELLAVDEPAEHQPTPSLDVFVDEERRVGCPPAIDLPPLPVWFGAVTPFGASDLVSLGASPASCSGRCWHMSGVVHWQRGLDVTDGRILGIDHHEGARFEILLTIGKLKQPLPITVTSITLDDTQRLQSSWQEREPITIVVRVLTATAIPDDDDHVLVSNFEGGQLHVRPRRQGDSVWRGFYQIDSSLLGGEPHPWALIVQAIEP